jgi:hypothetical protein
MPHRTSPELRILHAKAVCAIIDRGTPARSVSTVLHVASPCSGTFKLDIAAQTRAVIENIRAILKEGGADLSHVVDMTVFLVDMKDYQGMSGPGLSGPSFLTCTHQNRSEDTSDWWMDAELCPTFFKKLG